jgi:hypothetical protein
MDSSENGSIAQLDQAVDHSGSDKRETSSSVEILFDQLDGCMARMAEKSSRIESKLHELESRPRSSFFTWKPRSHTTRKRRPPTRLGTKVIRSLLPVISSLSTEIADLRQEQSIMSAQVSELHRAVVSDEV